MKQPPVTHVLLIIPWLKMGGADKFNLDLAKQLRARDVRVTITTTVESDHPWRTEFAPYCADIIDLTRFPASERPIRLSQIIQQNAVDVVCISHSAFGYAALPYLRACNPEVAFTDYCHIEEHTDDGGFPGISVRSKADLDLQIVSSQHLQSWYAARGVQADHVAVATTNIDPSDWSPMPARRAVLRAELGIRPDAPVILYAGRLARQKQPLLAMDVMRDVALAHTDAVFLIAGDGQFAPYVRGFIQAHRLTQQIRFLGAQPLARMRELLALSDIFFLPSEMEGISLAIYEAMAMGVVPLSAAEGGQAELVTPEVGILIERSPAERRHYTDALNRLIASPEHVVAMGYAAHKRITTHFGLDLMGMRMLTLFGKAAQRRHGAEPQELPDSPRARNAAHRAVALAQRQISEDHGLNRPWRRMARSTYWWAVEHGVWWIVPLTERLRGFQS